MPPTWLLIIVIVCLAISLSRAKGSASRAWRKQCRDCGGIAPASANFCGQCGRAFGGHKKRRKAARRALRVAGHR